MAQKRMLVADPDGKAWDEFRQALGDCWVVAGAASADAALAEAQKQPFDAIVANYDLPGSGGAELLDRIRGVNPKALRFIAADAALKEKVMCSVTGGHQFLAVPFNRDTLKISLERSLEAHYGMSDKLRELVGRIRTFPTIPSIYLEVVNALKNPNASTADIGAIVARDLAMTTKLVQVINSAYFGLPRTITDPTEAIGILGFENVKSLIMTIKLLSQYDKIKPVYFSIDSIWRHSTNVARTARVMALLETNDTDCSSTAYTAGLMHDLGKVILAANFDEEYNRAHIAARKQQMPLWAAEKAIFGATHGEIGAYLLAVWGLSAEVVKVAALHHYPSRADDKTFTALTAVHVANVLEYEANPEGNGLPAPVVDLAYLRQMGMENRVDLWRFARREPDVTRFETKSKRAKSAAKTVLPAPVASKEDKVAPAERPPEPFVLRGLWRWLGIGLGAGAALACMAMLAIGQMEGAVKNPPAVNPKMAAFFAPARVVQTTRPAPIAPAMAASEPDGQPPPAPAPPRAPAEPDFDRLKLEAIFFNEQHPSALISGKLAVVNELVADCRVLEISPSSVTVEYQARRKTLTLR
jgi:HD-like signal output (HDOD) protein